MEKNKKDRICGRLHAGCGAAGRKRHGMPAFAAVLLFFAAMLFAGCQRYEPVALQTDTNEAGELILQAEAEPASEAERAREAARAADGKTEENGEAGENAADGGNEAGAEAASEAEPSAAALSIQTIPDREPVKVKGIYLGANAVGVSDFMDKVIKRIDETELNAVVIDIKDDYGRITYQMTGVPLVNELEAVQVKVEDMPAVIEKLKAHDIYCIARIVALKDPYIAERKPEWSLHLADGSLFRDNNGDAWVNPYKQEYWDYLVDVAKAAGEIGFDEIQFDYIRFCTERGIDEVVYDAADTEGRDKITIISELVDYLSEKLRAEGLFVSCDVFGTIIGSPIDAQSVGQDYTAMSEKIDYICPMIYPSHYASGNFGLEHPDTQPYECILGALGRSRTELLKAKKEGTEQAVVRPWLQSFTASYLGEGNYIKYDAETTRAQIQAVYDAGYDEWIMWSASANYFYDGFLTPEAAAAEEIAIEESRAALPPETLPQETTAATPDNSAPASLDEMPEELLRELAGGELSESDRAILEQDGDLIISE